MQPVREKTGRLGKEQMHEEKTIQRFIELRAQGWTYGQLMTELKASKPTLIAWSRKYQYQFEIPADEYTTRFRTGRGERSGTLPSSKRNLGKGKVKFWIPHQALTTTW